VYAVIALIAGVAIGLLTTPEVPDWLGPYLPIAVVAALDAVLGGLRARLDGIFDAKVFVVSFIGNVLVAALIVFLGDQLGTEAALAEAHRQAETLAVLAGTAPATGPGVTIDIDDPNGTVPPEVLLAAVQELRNAGAEAIQVNGVRIGVDSYFSGVGGAVVNDGVALAAPYRIVAIGDPPTLTAAMQIPGGVGDTVKRAGGTLSIQSAVSVIVDALRPVHANTYARPAGG